MSQENWPVIGQEKIKKILQAAIVHRHLSQGYLFWGREYIGKRKLAQSFIGALLCEKQDGTRCGECSPCRQWTRGIYPDFYKISLEKGKKNIGVEEIRKVIFQINKTSFSGGYKVVLVEEAEAVSLEGYNALLKSLEEPPPKTVFIFLSVNLGDIPSTVLSRSDVFRLIPVSSKEILAHYGSQVKDISFLKEIVQVAEGRPYLVERFLAEPGLWENYQKVIRYFLALLNLPLVERFRYLESSFKKAKSFNEKVKIAQNILDGWLVIFRDLLLAKSHSFAEINNVFLKQRLAAIEKKYPRRYLLSIIDQLNLAKKMLRQNTNPQLLLENLILIF